MEKGKLILIGALCLIMVCVIGPASAGIYYSGGEKFGTNSIVPIPTYVPPTTGTIHIFNLAHNGWYSNEVDISPVVTNATVVPDGSMVDLTLAADGSGWVIVPDGQYEVYLLNGNGGQPETRYVTVSGGCVADAMFIGHASGGITTNPGIEVTSAQYGPEGVGVDVTAYFQSVLSGNARSVTITSDPSGPDWAFLHTFQKFYAPTPFQDPASGIEKGLTLNYKDNGKGKVLVIPNVYSSSTDYTTGNSPVISL